MRVARPSRDLAATEVFYRQALGMERLGGFEDHDGFDGVMLGFAGGTHHLEFTLHRHSPVKPQPTPEDVIVFYIHNRNEWKQAIEKIESRGHKAVPSHNPFWDKNGKTFLDPDGYRIVIQNASWG